MKETDPMVCCKVDRKMDRWIRAIAGAFVLVSVVLGYYVSPWCFLLTVYVGVNLFQSAFTNSCPMENLLDHLGVAKRNRKNPHFQ